MSRMSMSIAAAYIAVGAPLQHDERDGPLFCGNLAGDAEGAVSQTCTWYVYCYVVVSSQQTWHCHAPAPKASVTRDRQTLAVCKPRPPMEIPRVSERRPPFRNFRPMTEVSERRLTAIEKRQRVYVWRPRLKNFLPSQAPPENKVYMYVLQYD